MADANECHACSVDGDCGAGAFCLSGRCTAPCGAHDTCVDPTSTCFPIDDGAGKTIGNGCFPASQSCTGFPGANSGPSHATPAKKGGCGAADSGDLLLALLGLVPLVRRRR